MMSPGNLWIMGLRAEADRIESMEEASMPHLQPGITWAVSELRSTADKAERLADEAWQKEFDSRPDGSDVSDLVGFIAVPENPLMAGLVQQRAALLEAMRGVSEERWCAGWMGDLECRLYEEGGIWETIGRSIGWPTGEFDNWTWRTWDDAGKFFAAMKHPKVTGEVN